MMSEGSSGKFRYSKWLCYSLFLPSAWDRSDVAVQPISWQALRRSRMSKKTEEHPVNMIILWRILSLSIQDSDPLRRDLLSQHFLTGGEEQHIPSGMDTVSGTWWTQCSYCKWSFGCGSIDPLMSMMSIVTDPLLPVWHRETCFQHLKALTGWKFPIRLHGDEIREHSSAMFSCVYGCNATSEKLRAGSWSENEARKASKANQKRGCLDPQRCFSLGSTLHSTVPDLL